ncbi:hypothetical protein FKM82_023572 [Ascaphus truei]
MLCVLVLYLGLPVFKLEGAIPHASDLALRFPAGPVLRMAGSEVGVAESGLPEGQAQQSRGRGDGPVNEETWRADLVYSTAERQ